MAGPYWRVTAWDAFAKSGFMGGLKMGFAAPA